MLFALNFDGVMRWLPAHEDDARVLAAFLAHQAGDKGFGPALGPAATELARVQLLDARYLVRVALTPWRFGPFDVAIQREIATGVAAAALTVEPGERDRFERWRDRRLMLIAAGRSSLVVGHRDLLAMPRADRGPRA